MARPSERRSIVVGTGSIAAVHARAIRRAGGVLAGVVSRSAERAADVAAEWGAERGAASLAEAIETGGADVVHICTPNALHAEQVGGAVAAGLGVVCEKPLGVSAAQAAAMLDAVAAAGVVHAVPFAYRFYASVRELRARVQDGAAGRIVLVHGGYLQDWLADPDSTDWRVDAVLGGASRTFADIGIHWCDLAEFVTGDRISELVATTRTVHDRNADTEDLVALLFRTASGATGSMQASQVSWGRKNRLELFVDTERGSFGFEQEHPDRLWTGGPSGSAWLERGAAFRSPDARRLDRVPAGHPQGYQDCFDAFVTDVYSALGGTIPDGLPTFEDGLRAARLTEAVLESAASRQWVSVG